MVDRRIRWRQEARRAVACVVFALEEIRRALPFALVSIDSDNGSEFINWHLYRYCKEHRLQFHPKPPLQKR